MTHIIQLFKSHTRVSKPNYTPEKRKSISEWPESIESQTGFLEDETLILPKDKENQPNLRSARLVIIQDILGFQPEQIMNAWGKQNVPSWFSESRIAYELSENPQFGSFLYSSKPWPFELFRIEIEEQNAFSLFLNHLANRTNIGIPERENHKIAVLKKNQPIRYRINGKSDFTLSGRGTQRIFSEYDYIMEYLGKVQSIDFQDIQTLRVSKEIPHQKCKLIDERKILK